MENLSSKNNSSSLEVFAIKNKLNKEKDGYSPEVLKAFEEVSTIAQIVGGDFGMSVKLGDTGRGSFFNPEDISITIDPEHLIKNLSEAKFVVAHEGGHRAITRSPIQLGLSREKMGNLYSKPGFGFIQNAIEDPADNDWFSDKFPGLKSYVNEVYDEQFSDENATLSTPQVIDYAKKLGFMPRFAKFGSEIIRHWHQGRYAKTIDIQVLDALQKTESFVKQSIASIPDKNLNEDDVIRKAQVRFSINTEKVWPYVEKLSEQDLKDAERSGALDDLKQKIQEDLKQQQNQDDKDSQTQNQNNDGQKSQNEKNSNNNQGISDQMKQQLEQAGLSDSDIQKMMGKLSDSGQEEVKNKIKNKEGKKLSGNDKENELSELKESEQILDELSDALDKYIKSLPREKQEQLQKEAKRKLEDLEDALNDAVESKINLEKPKSHKEVRKDQQLKQEKIREQEKIRQAKEEQEKKLEELRKSMLTPYEKYRSEVSGQIDNLYYRLKRILKPEDFGKEDSGYSSGQTLDMVRVMQSDYDFNQKTKLWIRESDPEIKNYRFMNLIDMSGSMSGSPINEVFKGFVVVGEALDRLEDFNSEKVRVHQAIKGFHDRVFDYKGFNRRFSKELEDELATIVKNTNGGTNTYLGTISALEEMKKDLGTTGNFLLTFTDGSPNSDSGEKLKSLLKESREERRKKSIRVGLVWLNDATNQQLKEMVNEYGYDFGLILDTEKKKGKKDFSEKLGDVIEDIVENPQKY
jgi:hypothetical protein